MATSIIKAPSLLVKKLDVYVTGTTPKTEPYPTGFTQSNCFVVNSCINAYGTKYFSDDMTIQVQSAGITYNFKNDGRNLDGEIYIGRLI